MPLLHVIAEATRGGARAAELRFFEREIIEGGAVAAHAFVNRERGRIWVVATLYVPEFGADLEAAREALNFRGVMALLGGLRVLSLFMTDDGATY